MPLVRRDRIEIRARQRKHVDSTGLLRLQDAIAAKCLLHAPGGWQEGDKWVLSFGFRRLRCIDAMHEKGVELRYGGEVVPRGMVPFTPIGDFDTIARAETEFDENEYREPYSWQDRAQALADIHALRLASNPAQTYTATARELMSRNPGIGIDIRTNIREATILAEHMNKPEIAKARNADEALRIIMKNEGASLESILIERTLASQTHITQPVVAQQGDMFTILPSLEGGQFDLILADPPYGIGASSGGFRSRTVHHHNYLDTEEAAIAALALIIREGFRLSKSRANLFTFGDIDYFPRFKTLAAQSGWVPFRTPLTWIKGEDEDSAVEGLAPWGSSGPRRTCEWIFYATKGERGLHISPPDILPFRRVGRAERVYGPEKPQALMSRLIEVATMPGDYVLDPCCGAGSSLAAARLLKRRALGIEREAAPFAHAQIRASRDEETQTAAALA